MTTGEIIGMVTGSLAGWFSPPAGVFGAIVGGIIGLFIGCVIDPPKPKEEE